MRAWALVLVSAMLPLTALAAPADSAGQLRFGLNVAKQGLWQEARFRFERALYGDRKSVV